MLDGGLDLRCGAHDPLGSRNLHGASFQRNLNVIATVHAASWNRRGSSAFLGDPHEHGLVRTELAHEAAMHQPVECGCANEIGVGEECIDTDVGMREEVVHTLVLALEVEAITTVASNTASMARMTSMVSMAREHQERFEVARVLRQEEVRVLLAKAP